MGAGYYWFVADHGQGKVYRVYAVTSRQAIEQVEDHRGEWVGNIESSRHLEAIPEHDVSDSTWIWTLHAGGDR